MGGHFGNNESREFAHAPAPESVTFAEGFLLATKFSYVLFFVNILFNGREMSCL